MSYPSPGPWQPPHQPQQPPQPANWQDQSGWQQQAAQPWQQQSGWHQQASWGATFHRQYGQPQYGQPQYGQPQYGQGQWPGGGTYQQPVPGYPGVGYPVPVPPRRRSNAGKWVLAAAGVVVALLLGAVAVSMLSDGSTTAGGYVNENYQPPPPNFGPPPLPEVTTATQAKQLTEQNALYEQSVPTPTNCSIIGSVNLETASRDDLETYLNSFVECLMRVWDEPVTKAGYELPRPPAIVFTSSITTACGKVKMQGAYYCGADQRIYFAEDLPTIFPPELSSAKFVVEAIIAHEFGHHVQARTGILSSAKGLKNTAPTTALANEMNRRLEQQADCFSGAFLRSTSKSANMTQADLDKIAALMEFLGDDSLTGEPDYDGGHGLSVSRRYWMQVGLSSGVVGGCNTFTAPPEQVR